MKHWLKEETNHAIFCNLFLFLFLFRHVLEVVSKLRGKSKEEIADICYQNTLDLFSLQL